MINISELKVGDEIRSFDFEPTFGRADRFVDGIITSLDNGLTIEVKFDSVFKPGDRDEVFTGLGMLFSEWNGRLQVVRDGEFVVVDTEAYVEEGI